MPKFWEPPTKNDTKPKRRLWAENGMSGTELPQPHVMSSPPGTRAPVHLINYTPKTNEVHGPGIPAPEHELNYSLLPHDAMSGMGSGADMAPGPGMMPGQGGVTGRYGTNAQQRANSFSPGQPPLSPYPYGTGPGPQLQASGPSVRPFQERGTSMGNASTFGQPQGSFMSGPVGMGNDMGAGQAAGDPLNDWRGIADEPAPEPAEPTPVAPPPATGPTPTTAQSGGQPGGSAALPSIPGWKLNTTYGANGAPLEVFYEPDPPDPTGQKKPIPVGIYVKDITGVVTLNRHPQFTADQIMGLPGAADAMQVVTLQGSDGRPHQFLVDKKNPQAKVDLGAAGETPAQRPKKAFGEEDIKGEGQAAVVYRADENGDLHYHPERTAEVRAENARTEGVKSQADKDKAQAELERAQVQADASSEQALINQETQLATADMFSTFQDAQGQTWLTNNNTGARQKVGKADLSKGTMTVDNKVIRLNEGGKATVEYEAPEDMVVDTINGQTVQYNPKDPKGSWKVVTEDEFYKPTKQQALERGAVDIEKLKADMATGKISNAEARIKMAESAYQLEHPEPRQITAGSAYIAPGGAVDVHYEQGVKRIGGKPLPASKRAMIDRINSELAALDQGAASKPGGAATGGAATTPAAAPAPAAAAEAKPAEAKPAAEKWPPDQPWQPRADQTSGYTPMGNEMADTPGRTGMVNVGDANYLGSAATPEQIEAARAGWTPSEEEEELGAGQDDEGEEKGWLRQLADKIGEFVGERGSPRTPWREPAEREYEFKTPRRYDVGAGADNETFMGRGLSPQMGRGSTGAGWEPQQGYTGSSTYEPQPLMDRSVANFQQDATALAGAGQDVNDEPRHGAIDFKPNINMGPEAGWKPDINMGPKIGMGPNITLPGMKAPGPSINTGPSTQGNRRVDAASASDSDSTWTHPVDWLRDLKNRLYYEEAVQGERADEYSDYIREKNPLGVGQDIPQPAPAPAAPQAMPVPNQPVQGVSPDISRVQQDMKGLQERLTSQLGQVGTGNEMGAGQEPPMPPAGMPTGAPPGMAPPQSAMPTGAPPGMAPPAGQMPGWEPPVPEGDVAGIGHRFGQPMNEGEPVHSGVDLQATEGTPTISPEDGIVEDVRNDPSGLGLTVIVRDKNGMQHKLGHLDSTQAYRGMVVAKGQNLARVGSSGNTTGSHLHWAVKDQQGQPQDPTPALGQMGSLPPVPGTEMMGPPGGTGSPPGAAAGAPSGPPMPPPMQGPGQGGLPEGVPPDIEMLRAKMGGGAPQGMGNDSGMGAGAEGDDAGDLFITPDQQAQIDSANRIADQQHEAAMAGIAQRREQANQEHEDRVARIQLDAQIHQDTHRLNQEIAAEDARHNQVQEAIERERIQADIQMQQMRDANAIKLQQMQNGNQIYLQQGAQAFEDFQAQQAARLNILGTALKNPWMQRLSGMTPGANYQGEQVGGQNISNLINQILQPYDPTAWGAQNAPQSAGLDNAGATAGGGPPGGPQQAPSMFQQNQQYWNQPATGATMGQPPPTGAAAYGWNPTSGQPKPAAQAGTPADQTLQTQGPENLQGTGNERYGAGQATAGTPPLYQQPTWNQWRGWDPFQRAAFRTDVEAIGPGAWEEAGQAMADQFAGEGGNERVTKMQAAGSGEPGRAGMEMTADVFGKAPQQFWQEQNRDWSQAQAPRVKQNLAGPQLTPR